MATAHHREGWFSRCRVCRAAWVQGEAFWLLLIENTWTAEQQAELRKLAELMED
jgi:hypothetical protein